MNIYETRSNRSKSACGYCRQTGHNINECPQVAKDYAYWRDYKVPLQAGNPCRWYNANSPKYWGEWYTKCVNAMQKQLDHAERLKNPKKRVAKDRNCGFCGGKHHTRRNCDTMDRFLKEAYSANANWRKAAYELLVNQYGISVGAAIKVKEDSYYTSSDNNTPAIGLITSVNWDKLNLACANRTWGDYRQSLEIEVMVNGKRVSLSFSSEDTTKLRGTFEHVGGWSSFRYIDKVAPAPHPLDESWVQDYKDAFDFLVKKRNLNQLKEAGIVELVDKWMDE